LLTGLLASYGLHDRGGSNLNWVDNLGHFPLMAQAATVGSVPDSQGRGAASFPGTAGSFLLSASPVVTAAPFSYSAWFLTNDLSQFHVLASQDAGTGQWRQSLVVHADGSLDFYTSTLGFAGANITTLGGLITAGTVHHGVGTYDGSTAKIYLDGVLRATGSTNFLAGLAFSVGGPNNGFLANLANGWINLVNVWGKVLTDGGVALNQAVPASSEVGQLWHGGQGLDFPFTDPASTVLDQVVFQLVVVDIVDFLRGRTDMSRVVTTGLFPLTVGSQKTFQLAPLLDEIPWDLTGGSASLILSDPNNSITTITATIANRGAVASWTVAGTAGRWTRTWKATDAAGDVQYSVPIPFDVVTAP
jgi:hypothetical protein